MPIGIVIIGWPVRGTVMIIAWLAMEGDRRPALVPDTDWFSIVCVIIPCRWSSSLRRAIKNWVGIWRGFDHLDDVRISVIDSRLALIM